jgi:hypothetical protein
MVPIYNLADEQSATVVLDNGPFSPYVNFEDDLESIVEGAIIRLHVHYGMFRTYLVIDRMKVLSMKTDISPSWERWMIGTLGLLDVET